MKGIILLIIRISILKCGATAALHFKWLCMLCNMVTSSDKEMCIQVVHDDVLKKNQELDGLCQPIFTDISGPRGT